MANYKYLFGAAVLISFIKCQENKIKQENGVANTNDSTVVVKPLVVTDTVLHDTDDPAIWINSDDLSKSLVVGTDKDSDGGLYVFGLDGKIVNKVSGLKRPNNVDIAYGLMINNQPIDIAVTTERETNKIRIFSLPEMKAIDNGGIYVFAGEVEQKPMGIALYTRPSDKTIFAIVGRKSGPEQGYLWQYKLTDDGKGNVRGELVRKFGKYSGKKEIESIVVDNELGYVYYSDEQTGIRKYYADPGKGDDELAIFGQGEYNEDSEGISIYKYNNSTGYILVSDQSANKFNVYPREGNAADPNIHRRIASIPMSTNQSDGSDVTSINLPGFSGGLFAAMSDNKTFQFYQWKDLADKAGLKIREN